MKVLHAIGAGLRRALGPALRRRLQRKRHNRYREAFGRNGLLRDPPDPRYVNDVRAFWAAHYGEAIHPFWHIACANATGKVDVRYIPTDIWFEDVLPFFNRMDMREAYIDKNLADLILGDPAAPRTVIRRIHGEYYDHGHGWIDRNAVPGMILDGGPEQIIKPSLTDNGVGIRSLQAGPEGIRMDGAPATLEALEQSHGADFIIQARIRQHATMAEPHPDSVNTVRLLTFRWGGEIRSLLAFARFGVGGKLTDNAGTGGVCCGIDADGRLHATAVDEHGALHSRHPTTGYDFGQRASVPNFDEIRSRGMALHRRLPHFDLVSWDFAVGEDAEPVFVEFNLRGAVYIYQFACGSPVFGDLTQDVLERIRDSGGTRFASGRVIGPA
ncbi:MAG TPA: sugar-transfer associated ATP-grasp domain-containing protein [Gemmatimonadales bacterium]|nr:sugar-transfer associated ATP-grasp domain-containing protein [Gemmatimonadales bacterium]